MKVSLDRIRRRFDAALQKSSSPQDGGDVTDDLLEHVLQVICIVTARRLLCLLKRAPTFKVRTLPRPTFLVYLRKLRQLS